MTEMRACLPALTLRDKAQCEPMTNSRQKGCTAKHRRSRAYVWPTQVITPPSRSEAWARLLTSTAGVEGFQNSRSVQSHIGSRTLFFAFGSTPALDLPSVSGPGLDMTTPDNCFDPTFPEKADLCPRSKQSSAGELLAFPAHPGLGSSRSRLGSAAEQPTWW